MIAATPRRRPTTAVTPIELNRPVATAAPTCWASWPMSTRPTPSRVPAEEAVEVRCAASAVVVMSSRLRGRTVSAEMPNRRRSYYAGMTAELRHLRAFLQVAEAGTITAAAARMHMTQPAVSRLLAQLEAHLGVRLVERSTHHLTLTDVGAAYRDRAAAAVAAVETVLDATALGSWPLRLGHAWSALGAQTPALLRRGAEAPPVVGLQLVKAEHRLAGLHDGRLDAAAIHVTASGPGLRSRHIYDESR